jgi:protein-S-isoprenylcysteine O-methyltransferase Ste14
MAMSMRTILVVVYFFGILAEIVIRAPYRRQTRDSRVVDRRIDGLEYSALILLLVGTFVLPLVYAMTPWLGFADYTLPDWAGWLGIGLMGVALWVFWRSHVDLGRNWSASLEIREEHRLITQGIYGRVRHPMYASQWVWGLAQLLLIQNWIAGPGTLVAFGLLYLLRVPREEAMMLEHFGSACLTFHTHPEIFTGQENRAFVGQAVSDAGRVRFVVERPLADWSLGGSQLQTMVTMLLKRRQLRPRLAAEAARRGQPILKINLPEGF